ncbi:MAG: capsular polysaccharide biosynthesis protein [Clostridia bacterium]|nr:capsular polysaccharide biosynthesis protein [Clostridia bacterium]
MRTRVDCHSHCLPAMDDGAKTVEQALEMLAESRRQGVDTVLATPHFYAGTETVEQFLRRREASVAKLVPHLTQQHPRLLVGAEVLMRRGISRLDLRPLCIEGTDCLLLELPFTPPSSWLFEEVESIILGQRVRVVLAHVDRYQPWYSERQIAELTDLPDVVMQLNGQVFLQRRDFRRLRRWLPAEPPVLLGSDMHNATTRPPVLGQVYSRLQRQRRGRRWLEEMEDTAAALLEGRL